MCKSINVGSLENHFEELTDPRRREGTYPLINIVTIAICAVICGADDFVSIAAFGRAKKTFFEKFLDLSAGIPSHDRFNAIFAALKPEEFEKCLLGWITSLHEVTKGQVIAIDGKTLRRSYDKASSKSAIHMVSAWATLNHISLGQTVIDNKSNEITAIPKLLDLVAYSGSLVTIDAMGCQTKIAQKIVDGGGDYVLAVKSNQKSLHNSIRRFFADQMKDDFASTPVRRAGGRERGHGRDETRSYYVCKLPDMIVDAKRWPGLRAIGMAINETIENGRTTREVRYYILSKYLSAKRFGGAVRSHWGIENSLHWQLDVTFGEDQSRLRKGHVAENMSSLRRIALSLLKNNTTQKLGIKNKRLNAGWDENYLAQLLCSQ
jgi:predicted transposase YbfD/YdcC